MNATPPLAVKPNKNNITGAIIWVAVCAGADYLFGNVPVIKENFSLVAIGIVLVSVLPIAIEFLRARQRASQ